MKLSFLCSSAEPGRDGVGDYTAQFARALAARGHRCQVVALADRHIAQPVVRPADSEPFELVRIPAAAWNAGDIAGAQAALRRFDPDWTSLQMVCYGYEARGLLLRSAVRLARLQGRSRRQIMFHELWVGASDACSLRDRALGWMQERLVLRALRAWDPLLIHTSNPAYRELLGRSGVAARELPLPCNIPVAEAPAGRTPRAWALERVLPAAGGSGSVCLAAVFGSIHPGLAQSPWLPQLRDACRRRGDELVMIQAGRPGPAGLDLWNALKQGYGAGTRFVELGPLPPGEVSLLLQGADLGVSTSPWPLVGKSSTTATMLEHGVPVVVVRQDFRLRHGATPEPLPHPLLFRFGAAFLDAFGAGRIRRQAPQPSPRVFDDFIESLSPSAGQPVTGL